MRYIPRSEQSAYQVGYSMLTYVPSHRDGLSDEYFDGVPVASKSPALHWIEENEVHRAPWLSSTIDSSSYFLGPQSMLCRDELRDVTHVAVPDDGLIMKTSLERFSSVLNRQGFPNQFGSDSCFLPGAGGRHGWDSLFQWICARA
jgi:hypothetical protein